MKKLLAILLALVFVLSMLASCGDDGKSSTPKATTPKKDTADNPGTEDEIPEEELLNLDLDAIDHEGASVTIFHWGTSNAGSTDGEFTIEEDQINNDAVYDALYRRNLYTENGLGIELNFHGENYGYNQTPKFIDKLAARVSDPNTPVDLIACQTRMMPSVMVDGYLTDLNIFSDIIDLDKVWWPEGCRETLSIKDRLYFISGDISSNLLRMMQTLFVNKTHLNAFGYDYDIFMKDVLDYKWTLDDLIEMTTGRYQDLDTVQGPSDADFFGIVTTYFHSDALFAGCGFDYMVQSSKDDEIFKLSIDLLNGNAYDYVTKLTEWNNTHDMYMDPAEKTYENSFKNGNSLFLLHRAWFGFELQKTDIQYAVVPAPLLNDSQKEYYTTMGTPHSSYGVCSHSPDYEIAAETVQTLGYYGYKYTTPAVFEVSFKGKFSKDDYTIQMFNIIREGIVFDVGKLYDTFISGADREGWQYYPSNMVSWCVRDNIIWTTNFSTARQILLKNQIEEANKKILDFINADN